MQYGKAVPFSADRLGRDADNILVPTLALQSCTSSGRSPHNQISLSSSSEFTASAAASYSDTTAQPSSERSANLPVGQSILTAPKTLLDFLQGKLGRTFALSLSRSARSSCVRPGGKNSPQGMTQPEIFSRYDACNVDSMTEYIL